MPKFNVIDLTTYPRVEHFNHYLNETPCTYSLTTKLDVSHIKATQKHLYAPLLYCLAKVCNEFKEFRMDFDEEGRLGYYDYIHPCFTLFDDQSETFSNIYIEYIDNYHLFCKNYELLKLQYRNCHKMNPQGNVPKNIFCVSMIPWIHFDGFNLNLKNDARYLLPIFTFGKYSYINNKLMIPLSIQVNHCVIDGFHVSRFINALQNAINNL